MSSGVFQCFFLILEFYLFFESIGLSQVIYHFKAISVVIDIFYFIKCKLERMQRASRLIIEVVINF